MDAITSLPQAATVKPARARCRSKRLIPPVKQQQATPQSSMLRSDWPNKSGRRATRSSVAVGFHPGVAERIAGHVGYGSGIHQCVVGQRLARLEGECVLSALARKAAAIEITGPPQRRYNDTLRALASLPVAVRPA
jgi:hypothetical protein